MRTIQKLNHNWIFTYHDGSKKQVTVPHTWNNLDGQDGGDDYYRGTCTYETNFLTPIHGVRERVYLQFDGVNSSSRVVLNGVEVMKHDGGYSTFRGDVTDLLEKYNHLTVYVDNSPNDNVYPQKADFTFYGGIYRDVKLIVVNEKHFDLDYYGGNGIAVSATVDGSDGNVRVRTWTNCDGDVSVVVYDAVGTAVAYAQGKDAKLVIPNVHLWDGVDDPYLYTCVASLSVDGHMTDMVKTQFGVRTFYVDPQKGFFLNGRSYPLRGVCRHQDWKGIGNAISTTHHDADMELIREIGANTIRLAHYQHDQYFYDLCDKYGMAVWAEIPYISEHLPNGRENTVSQMKELIVQNFNHPSIVTWGISNEITISTKDKKGMLDNHHMLNDMVHEMDPTRPTTMACYAVCGPFNKVTKITDIIAWNLYLGWYVPGLFLNDLWIGFYHLIYPNRCLGYSEYGAEGMPNLHSEHPHRGDNTEEYQNIYHEFMLRCFKRHPYMWGTYIWNMFDFAADARNQGGEPGMNHKGMVTFDRSLKKDSFYLYKAHWNKKDPFVYIAGRRFVYRKKYTQEITIYSNQPEVSLYVNDVFVQTKKGDAVYKFKVNLTDGENKLTVKAGELLDQAVIIRTDEKHPEYKVQKVDTKNWM